MLSSFQLVVQECALSTDDCPGGFPKNGVVGLLAYS